MRIGLILSILLLCAFPALSTEYLYCSMPDATHVYHFDVSIHEVDDFSNGGSTNNHFNYLEITNFVKMGPSDNRPDYTEYRVMDISFLKDVPYRITVIAANKKFYTTKWIYGHGGISEPLFTGIISTPQDLEVIKYEK